MKKLKFPPISDVDFENLKRITKSRMKSIKGGYTSNTVTVNCGCDDGDDGIRND